MHRQLAGRLAPPAHAQHPASPAPPQVAPGMSVPAFLAATEPLIAPLDAYFEKVFVMCEDAVSTRAKSAGSMRSLAWLWVAPGAPARACKGAPRVCAGACTQPPHTCTPLPTLLCRRCAKTGWRCCGTWRRCRPASSTSQSCRASRAGAAPPRPPSIPAAAVLLFLHPECPCPIGRRVN